MKNAIFPVFFLLLTAAASAQIYEQQYDRILAPMQKVVNEHNQKYSNIDIPGADEDIKEQSVRYDEMVTGLNEANERHFNQLLDTTTILEKEK